MSVPSGYHNADGYQIQGTSGRGTVLLPAQSTAPVTTAATSTIYGDSTGRFSMLNATGSPGTFDTSNLTATRVYTLQNSSDVLVGRATTDTLTNKTATSNTNNITATGMFVNGGANTVTTTGSAVPTVGQVLTATAGTTATWQSLTVPTLASGVFTPNVTGTGGISSATPQPYSSYMQIGSIVTFTAIFSVVIPNLGGAYIAGGVNMTVPVTAGLSNFTSIFQCSGTISGIFGALTSTTVNTGSIVEAINGTKTMQGLIWGTNSGGSTQIWAITAAYQVV